MTDIPDEISALIEQAADLAVSSRNVLPFGDTSDGIARLASTINRIGGFDFKLRHLFAAGLYAREAFIPAGSLLISHIHREQHVCTCSLGTIAVFQPGVGVKLIKAPFSFVSNPGTQRVGIALEDTVWTSYHATTETSIGKLESALYDKREFPPYVDGDDEILRSWISAMENVVALLADSTDSSITDTIGLHSYDEETVP